MHPKSIFPVTLCFAIVTLFFVYPGNALGNKLKASATETSLPSKPEKENNSVLPTDKSQRPQDESAIKLSGESSVASFLAQPDIPRELLPSGFPGVRSGGMPKYTTLVDETLLLGSLPDLIPVKEPKRPPKLLPEPEPEPGIVYVVPFSGNKVPDEVQERIFDQFVDMLNQQTDSLGLQFVILKEGTKGVSPSWLGARKYITGEIYSYVENSGCCSTDMRTKTRITYHRPNQRTPDFDHVIPISTVFDHGQSTIDVERMMLADNIANILTKKLLKAFDVSSISEHSHRSRNKGV